MEWRVLLGVFLVAALAASAQGAKHWEDVLEEMRAHRSDARVQERRCGALANVALNADNQVKITAAGGIKDVLEAMRVHRSHAGVQEQGCTALWSLAFGNADNQVTIAAAGASRT